MVPMANRILLTCVAMALLPRTAVCGNVRTLVDQRPIATTGSTKLKYEINFNQEGEYAISAWVWLWKQSHPPEYVLPIFTSHIMDDFMTKSGADEMDSPRHTSALTPSMLYNGAVPEHFFFSASRDDNGNYANGFWGVDPVRYHEWMHVTFFMIDGRYSVYIDGKFQGSSSLFHPVRQFSAPLVSVNETIFFLGAASYGRSASAMFQQVHILSGEEARTDPQLLAVAYPPLRSSILYKLMREYNMFTLDEFTPVKFLGSFYGEMQWGLCPFSVCGAMCIDEAFYFTAHSTIRPSRTIPDIGNRGNKLDDLHKVVDRNSAVKTTAVKEKTVRKHKATDRQVLKSLAKRLKDAVLDQLDTIDLDPYGYDDYGALYLDDELLGVPAELLTDLDALSDAELNSINMWVEASLEGYEMNIDEYFDAIEGNGDEELIDGVDTSSNQHIISPVGYTMDYKGNIESSFGADTDEVLLKTYKRSSIVKDRSSSILPKRPKWKSRFLGSKKMVLTDEEIRGNNSISKIIVEQIQKIKFADNLYLIYKWLKGLVYNLEQPDHIRIQDSVTELDVSESVGSISSPETIDIGSFDYYEMYRALQPDIDDSVIQVQELYDSAMLWLNGRHTGFISHAHIGMYDWIKYSHAYSEAALFLALWLSFDVQLKELYSKNLMTEISVLDPLSHPIHLALAFRAGFSSKIVSDAFFMPKSFSGYQRSRHLTQFNTDYLSHLFGIEYSRSESDLSLHHALGGVGLADILKTNGAGKGDELDASLQAVKEAEITCDISVAYYFSVAQYVVNYFGQIETGVGKPEELRLADGLAPLELYEGEDALLHEVNAVEADGGNADAQMWMAMRYFWGYGGVQPNLAAARRLIENAAAAQHPEGLYNLGVLLQNGIAGYDVDHDRAIEYFRAAADHKRPFGMAVHAMGNHYLTGSHLDQSNITRAVEYYLKAIMLGSADAFYSLATIVRSTEYVRDPDITLSLYLYAKAASSGHVRSIYTLAEAFWDPESWLSSHIREKKFYNYSSISGLRLKRKRSKNADRSINELISSKALQDINYNASDPITVLLPGATDYIYFPHPIELSCSDALELFKFLGEHSFRIRDVSRAGYESVLDGDLWGALDYYEEASDLGSAAAQENAALLYDTLLETECDDVEIHSAWRLSLDSYVALLTEKFWPYPETYADNLLSFMLKLIRMITRMESVDNTSHQRGLGHFLPKLDGEACSLYYKRMSAVRRVQAASNKDPRSIRYVAEGLESGNFPFENNIKNAILMYGLAADLGDVHSLMSLGWIFYNGTSVVSRNSTLSANLFSTAGKWEILGNVMIGKDPGSTSGIAPLLAWLFVATSEHLETLGSHENYYGRFVCLLINLLPGINYLNYYIFAAVIFFGYTFFLLALKKRLVVHA